MAVDSEDIKKIQNTSLIIENRLPITAIILTLNEEENLPHAIGSAKIFTEEIFVVDSLSTDHTVDVSLQHHVKIVQRPFTDYGEQWQWAIDHLPIKTPWVLKLDADERVSSQLIKEMNDQLKSDPQENAFIIPIRLWFLGKPLHVKIKSCRLWKKEKGRFSKVMVNEHLLIDGSIGYLRHFIEHMDSANLHRWYEKQNYYTSMEAIMKVRGDKLATNPKLLGNALERRMFLKKYFHRIPFRSYLLWLYMMFIEGVWRDGQAGRTWAHLRVEVMRMIDLKYKEMKRSRRIPEIPRAPYGDYDPRLLNSPLQKLVTSSD
jgi:glycosyltransferase involved in cell wall biosynthesis